MREVCPTCHRAFDKKVSVWSHDVDITKQGMDVAFEGNWIVVYRDSWGKDPRPVNVSNPTWYDLWEAAETLILESEDRHHIYVENFHPRPGNTLELSTGS